MMLPGLLPDKGFAAVLYAGAYAVVILSTSYVITSLGTAVHRWKYKLVEKSRYL
jgi:hypothetical protein